jgi:glycosyltransferase involved in cell wall biosynthesis
MENKKIPVSVIVPIYNTEKYLKKCLVSLFEQTLKNIEYIFVNDGSNDRSIIILAETLSDYPARKQYVNIISHERNLGSAESRSDGIKVARGDYIICCDSDDWIETNMYEKMYMAAIKENADLVHCGFYFESEKRRIESRIVQNTTDEKYFLKHGNPRDCFYSLCNKLVGRELYLKNNIDCLDAVRTLGEDALISIQIRYFSRKSAIVNDSLYHYNIKNNNSNISIKDKEKVKQLIFCARYIESFFREHDDYNEYIFFISDFKFRAKSDLLIEPICRDTELWKTSFPETHKYIWRYKRWSLAMRGIFFLASIGFYKIAYILFDVKKGMKEIILK